MCRSRRELLNEYCAAGVSDAVSSGKKSTDGYRKEEANGAAQKRRPKNSLREIRVMRAKGDTIVVLVQRIAVLCSTKGVQILYMYLVRFSFSFSHKCFLVSFFFLLLKPFFRTSIFQRIKYLVSTNGFDIAEIEPFEVCPLCVQIPQVLVLSIY